MDWGQAQEGLCRSGAGLGHGDGMCVVLELDGPHLVCLFDCGVFTGVRLSKFAIVNC